MSGLVPYSCVDFGRILYSNNPVYMENKPSKSTKVDRFLNWAVLYSTHKSAILLDFQLFKLLEGTLLKRFFLIENELHGE